MEKRVLNFTVIIEKDEEGYYVGTVPSLKGCHSQGKTMDELLANIKEAIELCLEVEGASPGDQFIGVQQVQVII